MLHDALGRGKIDGERWQWRLVPHLLRDLYRSLLNRLGCAWWARIHNTAHDVTYWLGPFARRRSLRQSLTLFIADLQLEGQQDLTVEEVRTCRKEPFTYAGRR